MPGLRVAIRPFAASGKVAERDESDNRRASGGIGVICQVGPLILLLAEWSLSKALPASSSTGHSL